MKAEFRLTKFRDSGLAYAIALALVQALIPDGVLTPDGQAWLAGLLGAGLAMAINWAKHRFGG